METQLMPQPQTPKSQPVSRAKLVVAIDPGSSSGAYVYYTKLADDVVTLAACNMPETPLDILTALHSLKAPNVDIIAVCEDVGMTRPGNSAKSAFTFAVHRGHLEMALLAAGIPVTWVRPQKWMTDLFGHNYPSGSENLAKRKTYIYEKMQEKWPRIPFTKRQADAMGILTWALEVKKI